MLQDHIAALLPPGNSRPLYVRWTEGGRTTPWVRAGDLRHGADAFVLTPRWDGAAFLVLWEAATSPLLGDEDDPLVAFAVPAGNTLASVATLRVSPGLRRKVREAHRARPRLR